MHISKVELDNFKSYTSSTFEFGRGTTSITGVNGAGKTSIIEAIAWAIFDTLDYRKDDIIRRGAKKGAARVTFESGLDEREYTVYRDTANGYYVYDPQLKARIADKKEEVTRFLWQHLGIEPGTDLELLYRHAIGVPQGTFTAIFLATAAERKKTFDGLLKVEEYRRSSDQLLRTVRFVEQQINAVNVKIARAEGEIARIDDAAEALKELEAEIVNWAAKREELAALTRELHLLVSTLDEAESKSAKLQTAAERSRAELARIRLALDHAEAQVERSREAVKKVAEVKEEADAHEAAVGRIRELERERSERQLLRDELAKIESALSNVNTESKHLSLDLEQIQKARVEIGSLKEKAVVQQELEKELAACRVELAGSERAAGRLKGIDDRLEDLREAYRAASADLNSAREKSEAASQRMLLENRGIEIVNQLAQTSAALERDERFQNEVRNGLCPILSAKCLNLKDGETLEGFITTQFGELRARITILRTEQAEITQALQAARDAELFGAKIPVLEKRLNEIRSEGERLRAQRAELEAQAGKLDASQNEVTRIESELRKLDNPVAKMQVLERDAQREASVREKIASSERNLERLESERRITVEKLESYKDLDSLLETVERVRERTAGAFRTRLANEAAAGQIEQMETAYSAAASDHAKAVEISAADESAASAAAADYDRELHLTRRAELVDVQRREAEAAVRHESASSQRTTLAAEIERLHEVRRSMQDEYRERSRLQNVLETTDFIRSTLREAAPLVAKNYVHHVSLEANHMFREIRGDAECTLKWTEDYGIIFEEAGYDRPFQSLSGGEQMAAALAVRLALLKQLSDIHIAFFDEPTANMDAERRENLAMQIGNISHFDQLFVISHDDTFEGHLDYEIRVGD